MDLMDVDYVRLVIKECFLLGYFVAGDGMIETTDVYIARDVAGEYKVDSMLGPMACNIIGNDILKTA